MLCVINNRAARAARILAVLCITTTWNYQIWGFDDNVRMQQRGDAFVDVAVVDLKVPNIAVLARPPSQAEWCANQICFSGLGVAEY